MIRTRQLVFALLIGTVAASAQIINLGVLDSFQVGYAANLNNGDSAVNVTNNGASSLGGATGSLCVNVYTFDPMEEMLSCCACPLTPNALASMSVKNSLLSNTANGENPSSAVIKLVATSGVACDPTNVTAPQLAPGLRAWGTTLHPTPKGAGLTENPFAVSSLSASELARLNASCTAVTINGSGRGICKGCANGAQ